MFDIMPADNEVTAKPSLSRRLINKTLQHAQDAVEFAENLLEFQFEYPMITFLLSSKGKAGNYRMLDCLNGGYTNSDTHEYPTNLLAFINSLDEQILITITEFMEE